MCYYESERIYDTVLRVVPMTESRSVFAKPLRLPYSWLRTLGSCFHCIHPWCRLGSNVRLFGRSGRILGKEDEDAAALVQQQMARDGVNFSLCASSPSFPPPPSFPLTPPLV